MLDRTNKNKMVVFASVIGGILVFDIFTVISNIFVAPLLDGYGIPDILIYLKTAVFLFLFIILLVWIKNENFKLTKTSLKIFSLVGLALVIAYFLSLYMYKYVLILETTEIIKTNILNGNPNLVYEFSRINYKTLSYVQMIFAGFNSELIIFAEAMVLQMIVFSLEKYEIREEPTHVYDPFLFDGKLFPLFFILTVASFGSLNIFLLRYDMLGALEMAIGIAGFAVVFPALFPSMHIFKTRNGECTQSYFTGTYTLLLILSILGVLFFAALFGLNILFIFSGRGTYRIISSFIALILSIVIVVRVQKIISLENK